MASAWLNRERALICKTTRASVYIAPTHNPTMTRVYSVSVPVCGVRSQKSNMSTSGHTRQIARISVTIAVVERDFTL